MNRRVEPVVIEDTRARCAGQRGQVFDDGPQPTGTRDHRDRVWLKFASRADELPGSRA
jgi:peptide methionine sulfoxide reductase MsrB